MIFTYAILYLDNPSQSKGISCHKYSLGHLAVALRTAAQGGGGQLLTIIESSIRRTTQHRGASFRSKAPRPVHIPSECRAAV